MRLGLVVSRTSQLRQLAPVAEQAVAEGHHVALLCDHRGVPARPPGRFTLGRYRRGQTGEFPAPAALTALAGGRAVVRTFTTDTQLLALAESDGLEAVLGVNHLPLETLAEGLRACGILVGQLQGGWDWVYSPHGGTRALFADVTYGLAEQWRDWWTENLALDGLDGAALDALRRAMKDRFVPFGYPGGDVLAGLDRLKIRARLGLPLDRRIVLFLPFPFGKINLVRMLALGRAERARQIWPAGIYGAGRMLGTVHLLLTRAWRHWAYVVRGWNDRRLVEEIRRFCVANDALLIVETGHQARPRDYLRATADHVFAPAADGPDHPPRLLQLLAVADLCIHFGSGFIECAAARVPAVSVLPGPAEWPQFYHRRERLTGWMDVYDFPGVTHRLGVPEAIRTLARRRLEDFPLQEDRWRAYMSRFFTASERGASRRILDDLQHRLAGGRPAGRPR
jgi:hypothetical protein